MRRIEVKEILNALKVFACIAAILAAEVLFIWAVASIAAHGEVIALEFAPGNGPETQIVKQFDAATKSIHYQMYNFTSQPVADALKRAAARGVEVVILLDHVASGQASCQADPCAKAGCQVFVDWSHPIAHNKVRLVDGKLIIGGSYNDSSQAHKNAENLVVEDDAAIVAKYEANFQEHLKHAKTLKQSHADAAAKTAAKAKTRKRR